MVCALLGCSLPLTNEEARLPSDSTAEESTTPTDSTFEAPQPDLDWIDLESVIAGFPDSQYELNLFRLIEGYWINGDRHIYFGGIQGSDRICIGSFHSEFGLGSTGTYAQLATSQGNPVVEVVFDFTEATDFNSTEAPRVLYSQTVLINLSQLQTKSILGIKLDEDSPMLEWVFGGRIADEALASWKSMS